MGRMTLMSTTHKKSQEQPEGNIYYILRSIYIYIYYLVYIYISIEFEGKNSTSAILTAGILSSPINKVTPSCRMLASLSEARVPPQSEKETVKERDR